MLVSHLKTAADWASCCHRVWTVKHRLPFCGGQRVTTTQQLQRFVINVAFHQPPLNTDPRSGRQTGRVRSRSERLISLRCSVQTEFPLRPAKVWSYSGDVCARYWTPLVLLENKTLKSKMCQAWPESLSAPQGGSRMPASAQPKWWHLALQQGKLSWAVTKIHLPSMLQARGWLPFNTATAHIQSVLEDVSGLTMASTKEMATYTAF